MFELLVIDDELIVQPGDLKEFHNAIETQFRARYLHRIVPSNGLCVGIKALVVRDRIVVQGEGSVQVKVSACS